MSDKMTEDEIRALRMLLAATDDSFFADENYVEEERVPQREYRDYMPLDEVD